MAQPATRSLGRLSEIAQVMVRHGFGYFLEAHKLTDLLPGVDVRRAGERFATRIDWLDSKHSFSFGQHYDPRNTHHGLLLVSNDDRDMATVGVNVVAFFAGARIFRVHSVRPNRLALDAAWALTPEESELLVD